MCVLCVPPLHTVWFHRCAGEETEAICVTPWETFLFFFHLSIYLLTMLCMKLPTLLLYVWSDVNDSRKIYTCRIALIKHHWHTLWCWTSWMITMVSCTEEALFIHTTSFIPVKEHSTELVSSSRLVVWTHVVNVLGSGLVWCFVALAPRNLVWCYFTHPIITRMHI